MSSLQSRLLRVIACHLPAHRGLGVGVEESNGEAAGKAHTSEASHRRTMGKGRGASGKFSGSAAKVPSPRAISTTPGTPFRMFHSEGRISSSS